MKVIFLDHYGVISLSNPLNGLIRRSWNSLPSKEEFTYCKPFEPFDKDAVDILNSIIEETGAEIVVSSDWKNSTNIESMSKFYKSQGLIKQPLDFTRKFKDIQIPEKLTIDRSLVVHQQRYIEILDWVKTHPEITHWVSIDDLHMGINIEDESYSFSREWGLQNFVWTPFPSEGIKYSGIKEQIKSYLVN